MFEKESLIVEMNDQENSKCKRIIFETNDETLVRAGMLKLGMANGTFKLYKKAIDFDALRNAR